MVSAYYERSSYDTSTYGRMHILAGDRTLLAQPARINDAIKPTVRLLSGTEIETAGEGTINNPYVIK